MQSTAMHDTQSGELLEVLRPASGDWVRGQVSTRSHVFRLDDDGLDRARRREVFQTWDRTLVVRENGVPVYSGLVTGLPYDKTSRTLTVKHRDVREILKRRYLFGVASYNPSGTVNMENLSRRGIITRLLYLGMRHPFSEWWPLPVNLPAEQSGDQTRVLYHYDFQTIEKLVSDVSAEEGGPDVDFHPVYGPGEVHSWDARIGDPYLSGPLFDVQLDAEESPATGVGVDSDGERQVTGVFAQGRGSEQDMRVAQVATSPGLSKDWVIANKTVDDIDRLTSLARAYGNARPGPTRQWAMRVQTEAVPVSALRIGSLIRTHTLGDPWLPDGPETHRVIGFSGSIASNTITVALEEQ